MGTDTGDPRDDAGPAGLLRPVTAGEIDTFWRDGVVCLRRIVDPGLLAAMEGPVADLLSRPEMADLTAMGAALAESGHEILADDGPGRGRFISGIDHWRTHVAFRDFALASPLPAVAAALLRSPTVRLWEDSVLVKEPGTRERTAWHQDLSYFHVTGEQLCTMWCPLDTVTEDSGAVRFVLGSHLDRTTFRPNLFVTRFAIPGTEGDEVPDVDELARVGRARIVSFTTEPGDVTVHHARTLHGAGPNLTTRWRRAISLRYCGDDARFLRRPGAPGKEHLAHLVDGDLLDDSCPQA